jgi:hypothetical protein
METLSEFAAPRGRGGVDPPPVEVPADTNYVAAFLTLACTLRCSYCINWFGDDGRGRRRPARMIPGRMWVEALNRLVLRPDLPITLQGGEPSLHPDFYDILLGIDARHNIDLLTNLQFDIWEFMRRVPPGRLKRDAPYASIRVSYHPETMEFEPLRRSVLALLENDYSVGVWAVVTPENVPAIERARDISAQCGIDFRIKEFLGVRDGEIVGTYKYPIGPRRTGDRSVMCRTTELLVGPTGEVHRCHADLYEGREPIGRLDDPDFAFDAAYRPCRAFGSCNPCDVKVKTNRFQQFGHTSVDIVFQ